MRKILWDLMLLTVLAGSCKKATENTVDQTHKIVSLNGAITETIAALGSSPEIVGVEVTSTYPDSIKTVVPNLGHVRTITVEPSVALQPTLVIAGEKDLNPELKAKIKEAGIELKLITQEYSAKEAKKLIAQVGDILGKKETKTITDKIESNLAKVTVLEKNLKCYLSMLGEPEHSK